jgi:hypothetical protein
MRRSYLEHALKQYDHIMTHRLQAPPPVESSPTLSNLEPDEPPWHSPDPDSAAKPTESPTQTELQAAEEDYAGSSVAKLAGGAMALRGIQSQTAVSALRNAPAWESLAEPLLGEAAEGTIATAGAAGLSELLPGLALGALGVSAVDRLSRNEYKNSAVKPGEVTFVVDGKAVPAKTFHETPPERKVKIEPPTFKADELGLDRAYKNPVGTHYDPSTKTLYVKGSITPTDWVDDAMYIPSNATENTERYQQAMTAYNDLKSQGKAVDRVVGHSLGGAVALTMQKNLKIPNSRTFGAPVMDFNPFGHSERYRHPTDIVSIMDRGATWGPWSGVNPLSSHSYRGFGSLEK